MNMKLHNTLSRKTEELKPIKAGQVTMYTCGPTVYLEPHIGNWRTFIYYDVLHRALANDGLKVKHVLNITDVGHLVSDGDEGDDKVEAEARKERLTAWQVAEKYTKLFLKGLIDLNIDQKSLELIKATDEIDEQIELVKRLEKAGAAYVIDDGVYFDTSKAEDYGKLAGLKRDQQMAGARIEHNPQKRHHADFALWKFSPKDQQRDMEWDSPWGKGFPGWHLECSAIIKNHLGETIDIHGGGVDHIGVHHTNEIAQSETAFKRPLANIWFHTEHMMVDGQKMSKSLGNVYLLDDITKQAPLEAFRLLMLQSHYRSQQNFSWEALEAANNLLSNLYAWADLQFQAEPKTNSQKLDKFKRLINDDLNTPQALAALSEMATENFAPSPTLLKELDSYLGIGLSNRKDITNEQKDLITKRQKARDDKDFNSSDELRKELLDQKLEIEDIPSGSRWRRLTN
jgi:cysteinyl-tRNA synthetase